MGRRKTGALNTIEVNRIDLKYLMNENFIKEGCHINKRLAWTNGCSIGVESICNPEQKWIQLQYTLTNNITNKKYTYNYQIQIASFPSNLGKGKILFFICPSTGKRCRILYQAYGSHLFQSRTAYKNRLYYTLQSCSKRWRYNTQFWLIDERIKKLETKRKAFDYNGKLTKREGKITKLLNQQVQSDNQRWSLNALPVTLRRLIKEDLCGF